VHRREARPAAAPAGGAGGRCGRRLAGGAGGPGGRCGTMGQARPIDSRTSDPHLIPASPLSGTAAAVAATARIAHCRSEGRISSVTCCGGRRHGPRRRSLKGPARCRPRRPTAETLLIEDDAKRSTVSRDKGKTPTKSWHAPPALPLVPAARRAARKRRRGRGRRRDAHVAGCRRAGLCADHAGALWDGHAYEQGFAFARAGAVPGLWRRAVSAGCGGVCARDELGGRADGGGDKLAHAVAGGEERREGGGFHRA
jgi:hypothetical protein